MSAASFCRSCGKALTEEEKAIAGNVHCKACAPAAAAGSGSGGSWSYGPAGGPSTYPSQPGKPVPGLAFALGFIPGVGAIYNAQYVKGMVHAVIFAMLAGAADNEDSLGILVAAFVFYMAFEAYHTAVRRLQGEVVDEFSSLIPRRGGGFPAGPAVLIALGVLFLLSNFGLLRFSQIFKFWPMGLIALGGYMLYERMNQPAPLPEARQIEAGSAGTVREGITMNPNMPPNSSLLRALRGPVLMIALGSVLALDHFTSYDFGQTWPLLLIVFGLMTLGEHLTRRPGSPYSGV